MTTEIAKPTPMLPIEFKTQIQDGNRLRVEIEFSDAFAGQQGAVMTAITGGFEYHKYTITQSLHKPGSTSYTLHMLLPAKPIGAIQEAEDANAIIRAAILRTAGSQNPFLSDISQPAIPVESLTLNRTSS